MAIRLMRQSTGPDWLELGNGVAVLVLPPSTPVVFMARARADEMATELASAGEVVSKAGGHIVGPVDFTDPLAATQMRQSLFVVALAELAVIDWRGVLADPGDPEMPAPPLAFDAAHMANLMADPEIAETFLGRYYRPLHEVVLEGNV